MTETLRDRDLALEAALDALAPALDTWQVPAAPDALVARTLRLASTELGRPTALLPGVAVAGARLPAGFRRELARLVLASLPALALACAWALFVWNVGAAWLAHWLPAQLAFALVAAALVAGLSALGLGSASLPLIAHRRALLRMRGIES